MALSDFLAGLQANCEDASNIYAEPNPDVQRVEESVPTIIVRRELMASLVAGFQGALELRQWQMRGDDSGDLAAYTAAVEKIDFAIQDLEALAGEG